MAFTVENMDYKDNAEVLKGPEAKVWPQEAGIPLEPKQRGGLEIADTPEPLSRQALMNNLEGNIFSVTAQNKKMQEELKFAFTPDERIKNLNRNPESSKQIQMETGVVVSG